MGFFLIIILALFWSGVVFIILAALGIIAISPWIVVAIWLGALAIAIGLFLLAIKYEDQHVNYEAYYERVKENEQADLSYLRHFPNDNFEEAFDKAEKAAKKRIDELNKSVDPRDPDVNC